MAQKTKSKSKSKVETYQKGYLTPWTFAFNSAKTTVLPNIDGGAKEQYNVLLPHQVKLLTVYMLQVKVIQRE